MLEPGEKHRRMVAAVGTPIPRTPKLEKVLDELTVEAFDEATDAIRADIATGRDERIIVIVHEHLREVLARQRRAEAKARAR